MMFNLLILVGLLALFEASAPGSLAAAWSYLKSLWDRHV